MSLAVQPLMPVGAALGADLGVALQPGAVVNAKVLQVLDANLVRLAIANLTLDVPTAQPLLQGQMLQLAVVRRDDGVALVPLRGGSPDPQQAPARGAAVILDDIALAPRASPQQPLQPTLTPQETQALAVAARLAVTKQGGLSPLFADLETAFASGKLPPPVTSAAAQLLGFRLPANAPLAADDVKQAFQTSGLLMEASMAGQDLQPMLDIKSALLVLRQALVSWRDQVSQRPAPLSGQTAPAPSQMAPLQPSPLSDAARGPSPQPTDAPSLRSGPSSAPRAQQPTDVTDHAENLGEADAHEKASSSPPYARAPGIAADAVKTLPSVKTLVGAQLLMAPPVSNAHGDAVPERTSPVPPPTRGALPAMQPVAAPSLAPENMEPDTIARHLLAETDGAIARQTLLQIASLPDRADTTLLRNDASQPRWSFEMPFVTPQGTAVAQFEIAKDRGGGETGSAQKVWRVRFTLDLEPAGPVHALIALNGDTTSVKLWAERPATAAQLRTDVFQLTQSLGRADLITGDIAIADGAPARGHVVSPGHFLNRAT